MSFGGSATRVGGRGDEDEFRLNKTSKLFSCNVDGCCLHSYNEDVSESAAEMAFDKCVTGSMFNLFLPCNQI